jgi:hypothetical protein
MAVAVQNTPCLKERPESTKGEKGAVKSGHLCSIEI